MILCEKELLFVVILGNFHREWADFCYSRSELHRGRTLLLSVVSELQSRQFSFFLF